MRMKYGHKKNCYMHKHNARTQFIQLKTKHRQTIQHEKKKAKAYTQNKIYFTVNLLQ